MKLKLKFILNIILGVLLLSCQKENLAYLLTDEAIDFNLSISDTKAMISSSSINKEGNRFMIYDIYSNNGSTKTYIENPVKYTGGAWKFMDNNENPVIYYWTHYGFHKFYGWLLNNTDMGSSLDQPEEFFGNGYSFNKSSHKITIPQKVMTFETPQYDYIFSEVMKRDMSKNETSVLGMKFLHLFTSFRISATNTMENDVTINTFRLENLMNSAKAEIDFSGDKTIVTYSNYSASSPIFKELETELTVPGTNSVENNKIDNILHSSGSYFLMWPQDKANVHSTNEAERTEYGIEYPEDWMIYIEYTSDGETIRKRMNFPNLDWEAGKMYDFNIKFSDKYVDFDVAVAPWDYVTHEINHSQEGVTIVEGQHLKWKEETFIPGTGENASNIYIKNGMPVEGSFKVKTPIGGTWLATLVGDSDAFYLSPENGVINGEASYIRIVPKYIADNLQRDVKVKLKFLVKTADGRTIAADVIQGDNIYTIVQSAN